MAKSLGVSRMHSSATRVDQKDPKEPKENSDLWELKDHFEKVFSFPGPPLDCSLITPFPAEDKDDLDKMFGYKVNLCTLKHEPDFDVKYCFNYHFGENATRRRKPQLIRGSWNYIPIPCRHVAEGTMCVQGPFCRFAHCREEVIYHPSKYKTEFCVAQTTSDNMCMQYGSFCTKAHGPRRNPVFESKQEGLIPYFQNPQGRGVFVCPLENRAVEHGFFMYVYKTELCQDFPWNCQCNGVKYHRPEERRRRQFNFSPSPCPNVKPLNGDWGDPDTDRCPKSWRTIRIKGEDGNPIEVQESEWLCPMAHTLLEVMYHPSVYKTGYCQHFDETDMNKWKCTWGRQCAHAHGTHDKRNDDERRLELQRYNEYLILNEQELMCDRILLEDSSKKKNASAAASAAAAAVPNPTPAAAAAAPMVPMAAMAPSAFVHHKRPPMFPAKPPASVAPAGAALSGDFKENRRPLRTQCTFDMKVLEDRLKRAMQCPFSGFAGKPSHTIRDPIYTECCDKTFCRSCLHLYQCQSTELLQNTPLTLEQKANVLANKLELSGRCVCKAVFTLSTINSMKTRKSNSVLASLLTILDSWFSSYAAHQPPPPIPHPPLPQSQSLPLPKSSSPATPNSSGPRAPNSSTPLPLSPNLGADSAIPQNSNAGSDASLFSVSF
jgi:hypothetical protein